jgi:2'-5' RNA ligase
MPPIRAFVAIRLEPWVDQSIACFIDRIRPLARGVSWTRPGNLHLTLKFLGVRVDRALIDKLTAAIGPLAAETAPFRVTTRGIGAFPNLVRPRTIFVGLHSDRLPGLTARVEDIAVGLGFAPVDRPFTPHLTIGRIRSARGFHPVRAALVSAGDRDFGVSTVRSLAIYQSHLSGAGSRYEPIAQFPFEIPIAS